MYIENVNLSEWKTKKEIAEILKRKGFDVEADMRTFRREVQANNKSWANGLAPYYIVHDNRRGYKAATSIEEIDRSIADLEKRSYVMLSAARKARLALGLAGQGSINNIKELRKARGMTGRELVKRMQTYDPTFDAPTLSRLENNKFLPTQETIIQLAEILGCETWQIISPQYLM